MLQIVRAWAMHVKDRFMLQRWTESRRVKESLLVSGWRLVSRPAVARFRMDDLPCRRTWSIAFGKKKTLKPQGCFYLMTPFHGTFPIGTVAALASYLPDGKGKLWMAWCRIAGVNRARLCRTGESCGNIHQLFAEWLGVAFGILAWPVLWSLFQVAFHFCLPTSKSWLGILMHVAKL